MKESQLLLEALVRMRELLRSPPKLFMPEAALERQKGNNAHVEAD